MSAYILFPNGTVAEYPRGASIHNGAGYGGAATIRVSSEPNSPIVATVPPGCSCGFAKPTNVRPSPATPTTDLVNMAEIVTLCAEQITGRRGHQALIALKKKLEQFDGRTKSWKG